MRQGQGKPSGRRGGAIAFGLLACAVIAAPAIGAGAGSPSPAVTEAAVKRVQPPPLPAPASFRPSMSRIISVRVRHTRLAPVRNSNSSRIGRAIASLQPTWVSGMFRYARNQYPHRSEVRAWERIRNIVHKTSPGAKFDVVLNAEQFRTPGAIRRTMARLRTKLDNDAWFFDFLSTGYDRHPRMIRAAVNSAHAHGEWVGGNVFGLRQRRYLPLRVDFWSVQDHVFHLNLPAVRRLARRKPVVYHLNSDPARPRSGGCRFIRRFNTGQRVRLVRRRAHQQKRVGFRFSYPVLFPQCLHGAPDSPRQFLYAYNAFRDPPMARLIGKLLDRYAY